MGLACCKRLRRLQPNGKGELNMDPIKLLVVVLLCAVVVSLGKAMFHLSSGPDESEQMARALTFRIGLSIALFLVLMLAWYFGRLTPHGLG